MSDSRPLRRLPRPRALRRRRDFVDLREKGQRRIRGCMIANWNALPSGSTSQAGFITSRRLGTAVIRNRARRLLREVFRLHQHELRAPVNAVLVARPSIVGKRLADVERDFLAAMRDAQMLKVP